MFNPISCVLALTFTTYAGLCLAMDPCQDLTQSELTTLEKGELVVHSRQVPPCPWPEVTIFAVVDAAPKEAIALFSNYQDHKTFIPDLIKSEPATRLTENEVIVDFEMHVPWPLANSKYSTGNVLDRLEDGGYRVSWYLVQSNSLITSKGSARFTPYGDKSLLKYQSLIHPDSRFARIFSHKMERATSDAVRAIVTYLEATKRMNPEKVRALVTALPR